MASKKHPSSTGSVPKGKSGTGRTLDHPGCGRAVGSVNNTRGMNATAYAGGKGHPSAGSVPRSKNPQPISHNTVGGKPAKVKGW